MDYDPSYTLRDKPRRSSLQTYGHTVDKYVQKRQGSFTGSLNSNDPSLPVARRPSDTAFIRRASEIPRSPTLNETTEPVKVTGRGRSATTTSRLTPALDPSSWSGGRLEPKRASTASFSNSSPFFLGVRGRSGTSSSIDSSATGLHSHPRSGTIASALSPLAQVTNPDLNASTVPGRLSPSSQLRCPSLPRGSFSSKRTSVDQPVSGAPMSSPEAIEEEPEPNLPLSPVIEKDDPMLAAQNAVESPQSSPTKSAMGFVPVLPVVPPRVASTRGNKDDARVPSPFAGWNFPPSKEFDSNETSPTLLNAPLQVDEPISPTRPNFALRHSSDKKVDEKAHSPSIAEELGHHPPPSPPPPAAPRWWHRIPIISWCFEVLATHFNPLFILGVFNIRSYFWPLSLQKAAYMIVYLSIIVVMVTTAQIYHWGDGVFHVLKGTVWPLMVVLICLDPVTAVYYSSIAPVRPLLAQSCRPDWEDKEVYELQMASKELQQGRDLATIGAPALVDSNTRDTALIIPCHDSELETTELVLASALRLFPPQNIFVVENGRSAVPPNRIFQALVHAIHPEINYIWSCYGNKNIAEYVGASAAHRFKYIATIDDDVILPANFSAPAHLIDDKTKGVCFPIVAVPDQPDGSKSIFVQWQEIEYKFTGLLKAAERAHGGVCFPHGAGSFWERETFLKVLRRVDLVFYADDLKKGLACMELDVTLSIEHQSPIETVVPLSFAGLPLPNYWTQRVRSWEMSRHTLYWTWFRNMLRWNTKQRFWTVLTHKFILFYALFVNVMDWLRLPAIIIFSFDPYPFWLVSGPLLVLPILPSLILRYWKSRSAGRVDLRNDLMACLTLPIYKIMYNVCSVAGLLRTFFTYYPNRRRIPTIPELEELTGDARPFWLDERFSENPGFLADEADSILIVVEDAVAAEKGVVAVVDPLHVEAVVP